jgi:hypothetical protein
MALRARKHSFSICAPQKLSNASLEPYRAELENDAKILEIGSVLKDQENFS